MGKVNMNDQTDRIIQDPLSMTNNMVKVITNKQMELIMKDNGKMV